jgi:hypothetical protein
VTSETKASLTLTAVVLAILIVIAAAYSYIAAAMPKAVPDKPTAALRPLQPAINNVQNNIAGANIQ